MRRLLVSAMLALASGLLLALAMPPLHVSAVAWLAFTPLLVARRRLSPVELGTLSCLAVLPSAWTLGSSLGVTSLAWPYVAALLAGGPLPFGIAAGLGLFLERRMANGIARALVFPCLLTGAEAFLRALLPGLPVPSLAWTQAPDSVLIQSGLTVASPLPVTFLIALTNVGIEDAFAWRWSVTSTEGRATSIPAATTLALVLFAVNAGYGIARWSIPSEATVPLADSIQGDER